MSRSLAHNLLESSDVFAPLIHWLLPPSLLLLLVFDVQVHALVHAFHCSDDRCVQKTCPETKNVIARFAPTSTQSIVGVPRSLP